MSTPSSPSPYLRNASATPNYVDWAALEAQRSPRFHAEVDRLRHLAGGHDRRSYTRTTGPLTNKSWSELSRLRAQGTKPQEDRPRAWKHTPLPTDDGLRHVRDYERGCRKIARTLLGTERAAPLVHDLVAGTGYRLHPFTGSIAPAPIGSNASSLAAYITGASWGSGATALRTAWQRARPGGQDSPALFTL